MLKTVKAKFDQLKSLFSASSKGRLKYRLKMYHGYGVYCDKDK